MKNSVILVLFCSFGALFSSPTDCCATRIPNSETERINLSMDDVAIEEGAIYIFLSEEWIPTKTVRNDCHGLYVFSGDITADGSRVVKPPKWRCPYCNRKWNYGEKCGNKDCPTNQWPKEEEKEES